MARTTSAMLVAPIFSIARARCTSTVLTLMPRSSAICLFLLPIATRSSTSRSRSVRVARRAAADLPLSPLAPGRRAQGGKLFDQGLFEGGSD